MSDRHAAIVTWNISTLLRLMLLDSKFSTEVGEFISHWMASPVLLSQQWRHRRSLVSEWLASAAGEAWYHSCNRVREYSPRPYLIVFSLDYILIWVLDTIWPLKKMITVLSYTTVQSCPILRYRKVRLLSPGRLTLARVRKRHKAQNWLGLHLTFCVVLHLPSLSSRIISALMLESKI